MLDVGFLNSEGAARPVATVRSVLTTTNASTGMLDIFREVKMLGGAGIVDASIIGSEPRQTPAQDNAAAIVGYLASAATVDQAINDMDVRLDELRQLPQNWYVHGAQQISASAIEHAKGLVRFLSRWNNGILADHVVPHGVAPLVSGGVELVWRGSRGWLEVFVDSDGSLEYVEEAKYGTDTHSRDGDASSELVPILLNRIL